MKIFLLFLLLLCVNVLHALPYRIIVMSSVDVSKATEHTFSDSSYNENYIDKELLDNAKVLEKRLQNVTFKKEDDNKIIPIFLFKSEKFFHSIQKGLENAYKHVPYNIIILDNNMETDYQVVLSKGSHKGIRFVLKVRTSFLRESDKMITILKQKIDKGRELYPSSLPGIALGMLLGTGCIGSGLSSVVGLFLIPIAPPVGFSLSVGGLVVFVASGQLIGQVTQNFRSDMNYRYQKNNDGTTTILGYKGENEKEQEFWRSIDDGPIENFINTSPSSTI